MKIKATSKYFAIAIASIFFSGNISGATLHKPEVLHPGDTIAIISMASAPDTAYITDGCNVLRSWGYIPVVGQNALERQGSFAGSIEQRLADLKWAFETPGIKAVMSSRGGYGSMQELALLPHGYFRKHPKWLIGYSDITAVHAAMATDKVMSIHAHMAGHLHETEGTDTMSTFLRQVLSTGKISYSVDTQSAYNNSGTCSGTLYGGNLSVLNDLADTPIDYLGTRSRNMILFIEDVGENIHSISRILYRLKFSGILNNISGLIIGQFTDYKPDDDYDNMNDMIHDIVKGLNIPIVFNFPVGHVTENYPLIQGSSATLTVNGTEVTLNME